MSNKQTDKSYQVPKPYVKIPGGLWLCPEFNMLKPHSRCVYMILLAKWDTYHPERTFVCTYDEIQNITRFNRKRIAISLTDLETHGWIKREMGGRFPKRVSLYSIELKWLDKKYPKIRRSLPDYMADYGNAAG